VKQAEELYKNWNFKNLKFEKFENHVKYLKHLSFNFKALDKFF